MRGFLCDGQGCGVFSRSSPAAQYEHAAWVSNGEQVRQMTLTADLCVDCAIDASQGVFAESLYSQHEVIAALKEDA